MVCSITEVGWQRLLPHSSLFRKNSFVICKTSWFTHTACSWFSLLNENSAFNIKTNGSIETMALFLQEGDQGPIANGFSASCLATKKIWHTSPSQNFISFLGTGKLFPSNSSSLTGSGLTTIHIYLAFFCICIFTLGSFQTFQSLIYEEKNLFFPNIH